MIIISPCIVGYLIRSNNTFVLRKLEFLFTCCMYVRYQIAKVVCLKILLFFAHMGWSIKSSPRWSYQYSPLQGIFRFNRRHSNITYQKCCQRKFCNKTRVNIPRFSCQEWEKKLIMMLSGQH